MKNVTGIFSCLFDCQKWDQILWKSHHFLSKYHGNSMTWTWRKFIDIMFQRGKQIKPG